MVDPTARPPPCWPGLGLGGAGQRGRPRGPGRLTGGEYLGPSVGSGRADRLWPRPELIGLGARPSVDGCVWRIAHPAYAPA